MEINPLVLHTRLRKIARPLQNLSERRVATTVWQIVLKIIPYDLKQSLKILLQVSGRSTATKVDAFTIEGFLKDCQGTFSRFIFTRYVFKPAISGQTLRDFTWPRFHNECSMPINLAWVLLLRKFITSHICVYYYVNDRVCDTSVLKTVKYDRRRVQENAFKCI